ncbi:hypothetical protein KY284_001025 [Solanum tuberosum]|nr:hypothetical protein KY284_001025 [Solanum tuberosum]
MAKTNKDVLLGNVSGNFAGSSTSLTVNHVHQRIVSIAKIVTTTSVGVFHIEAEISISDDLQKFCVLECSSCKQKKRTKEKKQVDCANVKDTQHCGSTRAFISGDPAEKLLSMKAEDIFDTTCVKNQLLRVDQTQKMLPKRLFHIQLRKSSLKNSNGTQSSLIVLSYTEKEHISLPGTSERNIKRAKSFDASEVEMKATFVESESFSSGGSIEPPTPMKRL